MVSPFPQFQSARFWFLVISKVCCWCYKIQSLPGLATTNTKWICNHSHDTCHFPTSPANRCWDIQLLSLKLRLDTSRTFFILHEVLNQKLWFFLALQCTFTFCKFGRAFPASLLHICSVSANHQLLETTTAQAVKRDNIHQRVTVNLDNHQAYMYW